MEKLETKIYSWDDLPSQMMLDGDAWRKVIPAIGCTIVMNYMKPNVQSKLHNHEHTQISFVLEGEGESISNGENKPVKPGSVVVIPPNLPHCFLAKGDKTSVVLDIFAPERGDHVANYEAFVNSLKEK